ncbi:MAG: hypothetical protein AB7O21_05355 [Gammaproteobacteria bacterium]
MDVTDERRPEAPRAARPPSRPLRIRLRSWRWWVPLTMLGFVALGVAYVLRPSVQRAFVHARAAPFVDTFEIAYLHVLPWSVTARGIEVEHRGARYRIGKLEIGFNPLAALLDDTVSITRLVVQHTDVDLRGIAPSAPATAPFPGLLPTLAHGYALRLEDVNAAVSLLFRGDHALSLRLQGGSFRPHVTGALGVSASYHAPDGQGQVDASGELMLSQLSRGRLREASARFDVEIAHPGLPSAEVLRLALRLFPPPGNQGNPYRRRYRTLPDGTRTVIPNPEAFAVEAIIGPGDDPVRARVTLDGLYRGEDGVVNAGYQVDANEALVLPYVAAGVLPSLAHATRGALQFDSMRGTGLVTFETDTRTSAFERVFGAAHTLPDALHLQARGAATFDPAHLRVETLALALREAGGPVRLEATSSAPLDIDWAAPRQLLDTPRALANVRLGPWPLDWFEGFVPGHRFAGDLTGEYAIAIDDQRRVTFAATAPTRLAEARVARGDDPLVESLALAVTPTASWSEDFVRAALNDLEVRIGDRMLARLDARIASRQQYEEVREWRHRLEGVLDVDTLRALPVLAEPLAKYTLPGSLDVRFKSLVSSRADVIAVEKLSANVGAPGHTDLLTATGLQTFRVRLAGDGAAFENPRGALVNATLRNIELAWLNPFLPLTLDGRLAGAAITVSAPTPDALQIESSAPLRLTGVSVVSDGRVAARDLALVTTPDVRYAPEEISVALADTTITTGDRSLVRGRVGFRASELATPLPRVALDGSLFIDVHGLAGQPRIADLVPESMRTTPLHGEVDFAVAGTRDAFTVERARAEFSLDTRTRVRMQAERGLTVRTRLAAGENLAQHVVGAVALDIADLSSQTLAKFVPLGGVGFAEINSSLRLRSDGRVLRATSLAPLAIEDVRITDGERALFEPFALTTTANLRIERRRMRGTFEDTALRFAGRGDQPAIAGDVKAELSPDRRVPLTMLDAVLRADLPQLLGQPVVMPGHGLTAGALTMRVKVDEQRRLDGTLQLEGLAARAPLAIQALELPLQGEMASDGQGFDFTAPVLGQGRSGAMRATVAGHYAPQPDEPRVLRLEVAGEVFYLNDILATIAAIRPQGAAAPAATPAPARAAAPAVTRLDETPDAKAAWKVIPYAVVIGLDIATLYYTDYLAFSDVQGTLDLRSRKLALSDFRARFHDSVLAFDGITRFNAAEADPYDLKLTGKVTDFNLDEFFTALLPGEKSRVEGLFGVKFEAQAQFPNFAQLRNRVLFDLRMKSRDGLFRPLPPDSSLLLGASDVLGIVGEGLSYVPTGGFGAGAVARLVNYIAEIDYDTIDIHLRRDLSRNVNLEQFLMLSPTIALTATGGIEHAAGRDILDSPLALNANLDMLGRGAAILYSMDLMRDGKNAFGYWLGPEFRIGGTLNAPESNFASIIQQAGDGTVKGAITRPISGLIGNLKYRWFGDKQKARDAARARQRSLEEPTEPAAGEEGASTTPAVPVK